MRGNTNDSSVEWKPKTPTVHGLDANSSSSIQSNRVQTTRLNKAKKCMPSPEHIDVLAF